MHHKALHQIKFQLTAFKKSASKSFRETWYRLVRRKFESITWKLWAKGILIGDRFISRRNAINRLDDLTWVEVDPERISTYIRPEDVDRKHFIWSGNWDLRTKSMTEHERFQLMYDLWVHRDALEETNAFKDMVEGIKKGIYPNHFNRNIQVNTPEKALMLLKSQLEIFDSLARFGYQPQLATDEIKVAVDRNGNLVKANGGRKRLSAAIIFGLPKLPVRIAYVHKDWIASHSTHRSNKQESLEKALTAIKKKYAVVSEATQVSRDGVTEPTRL